MFAVQFIVERLVSFEPCRGSLSYPLLNRPDALPEGDRFFEAPQLVRQGELYRFGLAQALARREPFGKAV